MILKFILKRVRSHIARAILNIENDTGGTTISDFRLYYRTITTKHLGIDVRMDR